MMKHILLVFLGLCFSVVAHSQSHNLNANSSCRFVVKKGGRLDKEGLGVCQACVNDRQLEEEFRKKEDKKKAEAEAAAYRKKEEERLAAEKRQREEETARKERAAKEGQVSIGGGGFQFSGKTETSAQKQTGPKKDLGPSFYLYTTSCVETTNLFIRLGRSMDCKCLLDANQDTVLWSDEVSHFAALGIWQPDANPQDFPKNMAIASFKRTKNIDGVQYLIEDLVNHRGERYFNDDNVSFIQHLYGGYFLVGYGKYKGNNSYSLGGSSNLRVERAVIHHVHTKETLELARYEDTALPGPWISNLQHSYVTGRPGYWQTKPQRGEVKAEVIVEAGAYKNSFYRLYYIDEQGALKQYDFSH